MIEFLFFSLLALFCLADVVTSHIALKSMHTYEMNKMLSHLMLKIGVLPALFLTKIVFLSLVWFFGMYTGLLVFLNMVYLAILINNIAVIVKIHRMQTD